MKFSFSRFLLAVAVTVLVAQPVSAQVVEIPDPNLEKAIREELKLPDENPITQQKILRLEKLSAWDSEITDLTGLERATFLIDLGLCVNQIHDLRPLAELVQLEELSLCVNQITDISPLANLINLKWLDLGANGQIVDITPLANLTRLERINLGANLIEDITPLSNLTQLTYLGLDTNRIRDITPLANLTLLQELEIRRNAITDITPLIGLKNLKKLRLADNPLHDFSSLLELEGVELDLDIDLSRLDELNIVVEVPDPNLRQAIREALSLPEDIPLTQQQMLRLKRLSAWNSEITDLTGLEHATFLIDLGLCENQIHDLRPLAGLVQLEGLSLCGNPISDISPLANLTNLKGLDLGGYRKIVDITPLANLIQLERLNLNRQSIYDITPLANLTQLTHLTLENNYVTDFGPLANLINLERLWINRNPGSDFTPLQRLNLTDFRYDQVCEMPPFLPPVRERIESRSFPSIFQPWNNVVGSDHLTWEQRNVLHDLHWTPTFNDTILWDVTPIEPAAGVATSLAGPLARAREVRQRRSDQNSNMIFLGGAANTAHPTVESFPPDSDFWLRDANGEILRKSDGKLLINFVKPEFQDLLAKRISAFARCGLYDGIMLDEFNHHGAGFGGRHLYPYTDKEIIQAYTNIFREVRKQVRDDFLIIINAGRSKPMHYAEYVNGIFMETGTDYPYGYTHGGLYEIENTLLWSEQNLRAPRINCLEGWGIPTEAPDSPDNRRRMRVFTTMSLTHSDGYVVYNTGGWEPGHFWYPFWDANLGRPVGEKAQHYGDVDGLFIREFTNGWAVYNRSGKPQTISLPESVTGVASKKSSITHILPDLDGEMYLKAPNPADVNGDGTINILDLVQVANGFGKSTPDPNGDSVVNILDLVFIASHFSQ